LGRGENAELKSFLYQYVSANALSSEIVSCILQQFYQTVEAAKLLWASW